MEAWWEITIKLNVLGVALCTEVLYKNLKDLKSAVLNVVQDHKS